MGVRAQTTHMKKVMKMTIYECVTNTTWAALRHTGHVLRGCKTMIVSPGGSVVDNPPAMCRTQVWSLGQEDLLEKEIATHSSILAWEILWTEGLGGLQSMGHRVGHNLETKQQKEWLQVRAVTLGGLPQSGVILLSMYEWEGKGQGKTF